MVDIRNLRPRTPTSTPSRAATASSRAKSLPPPNRRKELLDCVLLTPLSKARSATQTRSVAGNVASASKMPSASQPLPMMYSLSQVRKHIRLVKANPDKTKPSRPTNLKRKRLSSSSTPISQMQSLNAEAGPSRIHSKELAVTGLLTPAMSMESAKRPSQEAAAVFENGVVVSSTVSRGRLQNKGKDKTIARGTPHLTGPTSHSTSHEPTRPPTKRRKLSLTQSHLSEVFSLVYSPDRDTRPDYGETAIEEIPSFELLDLSEVLALPWMEMKIDDSVSSQDIPSPAIFVPPGVHHLLETMKHTLRMERAAREQAELRWTEETRKRAEAERYVAQLETRNMALENDLSAWTNAAADALVSQFDSATQPLSPTVDTQDVIDPPARTTMSPDTGDTKGKGETADLTAFGDGTADISRDASLVE